MPVKKTLGIRAFRDWKKARGIKDSKRMSEKEKVAYKKARRFQARDLKHGERRLMGHWFKMNLVPTPMPSPQPTLSGQINIGKFLIQRARKKAPLISLNIIRPGFFPRVRKSVEERRNNMTTTIDLPMVVGNYYQHLQSLYSDEAKQWVREKRKTSRLRGKERIAADEASHRKARQTFAFNIGINSIVEVGNDGEGNPTHILVLKRSPHVPAEPNVWDFPAGLLREGQKPIETIRKRTAAELGIQEQHLELVGPGLQTTKEEIYFTMMRVDALLNYNPIVIQRVNLSAEEIKRNVRKHITEGKRKKDKLAPTDFQLIPRNPEAIAQFTRTHQIFIPEVLRLYAQELGKEARKRP